MTNCHSPKLKSAKVFSCGRRILLPTTFLLLGSFLLPLPVIAQVKAAYVKDVDAPGRVPYEVSIEWTRFGCQANCSAFIAYGGDRAYQFDGPAIPAKKRFVLQSVTAVIPSSGSTTATLAINKTTSDAIYRPKWGYFGPFYVTSQGPLGMNSAAFTTIEPGESPHIYLEFSGNLTNNFSFVTLSGYLIDAN